MIGALGEALCLVNMSESESFGIVLLESWLAGRPVIAQRRCLAFADLVRDGENGMLAESAEDVARAIAAYLGDEALVRRHAEKGRAVAERCSWDTIAAEIETVLMAAPYDQKRAKPSPREDAWEPDIAVPLLASQ